MILRLIAQTLPSYYINNWNPPLVSTTLLSMHCYINKSQCGNNVKIRDLISRRSGYKAFINGTSSKCKSIPLIASTHNMSWNNEQCSVPSKRRETPASSGLLWAPSPTQHRASSGLLAFSRRVEFLVWRTARWSCHWWKKESCWFYTKI